VTQEQIYCEIFWSPRCSLFERYVTLTLHPSLSCATVLTRQ